MRERLNGFPTESRLRESELYLQDILAVEEACNRHGINHRFVGGTFTDLLGPATQTIIDIERKTIHLENYNPPTAVRSDGTIKDADLICFCEDQEKVAKAQREIQGLAVTAKKQRRPFPFVSLEPTHYSDWPEHKRWKQFVTTFEVDKKGDLSLNFGRIHQSITWESVEPWRVDLGNGVSFTILNPFAHALCYVLRVPSGVKKKDKEILTDPSWGPYSKMSILMRVASRVHVAGEEHRLDYKRLYQPWVEYIRRLTKLPPLADIKDPILLAKMFLRYPEETIGDLVDELRSHPDPLTWLKARVTKAYWDGPGEAVAHGRGVFKKLSKLSSKMSG